MEIFYSDTSQNLSSQGVVMEFRGICPFLFSGFKPEHENALQNIMYPLVSPTGISY